MANKTRSLALSAHRQRHHHDDTSSRPDLLMSAFYEAAPAPRVCVCVCMQVCESGSSGQATRGLGGWSTGRTGRMMTSIEMKADRIGESLGAAKSIKPK